MGELELKNRIVMAPMTRSRALEGELANPLMAEYYSQRAAAGLIVSEGTQVSQQGQGYAWTPGIFNPQQVKAWEFITNKVQEADGVIFAQLWHVGRVSHSSLQADGQAPVAPSPIKADGVKVYIDPEGKGHRSRDGQLAEVEMPRELTVPEIKDIIHDFGLAADNAMKAGFDGCEIHAANGYLIDQFINSSSNERIDQYGGALDNRLRFLHEVVEEVVQKIGGHRTGVRLAPLTSLNGTKDDKPQETYLRAAEILEELGVAYVHIAEADWTDAPEMSLEFKQGIRQRFSGSLIYAGKYDAAKAQQALDQGWADMIAFGRSFIANPDLPFRLQEGIPLQEPRKEGFFGGEESGLTDYPFTVDQIAD